MILNSPVTKNTVERTISTHPTAVTSGSDRNKNPVAPSIILKTDIATERTTMTDQHTTLSCHTTATEGSQQVLTTPPRP